MKKRNIDSAYFFIIMTCLVILGVGLYSTVKELTNLSNEVNNLKLAIEFSSQGQTSKISTVISEGTIKNNGVSTSSPLTISEVKNEDGQNLEKDIVSIPTAIIFEATSSPILQPQASVPILIESFSKNKEGELVMHLKAFTSDASSYSALEVRDLFELIDLTGDNQKPLKVIGSFDRMPPKSSVIGSVVFKIKPEQQTIILQINMGNDQKHYEFNFDAKTYKETVIG